MPAHANLGQALLVSGDVDGAIGEFEAALKLEPDNARLRAMLAQARAKKSARSSARGLDGAADRRMRRRRRAPVDEGGDGVFEVVRRGCRALVRDVGVAVVDAAVPDERAALEDRRFGRDRGVGAGGERVGRIALGGDSERVGGAVRADLVVAGVGIDEREGGAAGEARGDALELGRVAVGDGTAGRDEDFDGHRAAVRDEPPPAPVGAWRLQPTAATEDKTNAA